MQVELLTRPLVWWRARERRSQGRVGRVPAHRPWLGRASSACGIPQAQESQIEEGLFEIIWGVTLGNIGGIHFQMSRRGWFMTCPLAGKIVLLRTTSMPTHRGPRTPATGRKEQTPASSRTPPAQPSSTPRTVWLHWLTPESPVARWPTLQGAGLESLTAGHHVPPVPAQVGHHVVFCPADMLLLSLLSKPGWARFPRVYAPISSFYTIYIPSSTSCA